MFFIKVSPSLISSVLLVFTLTGVVGCSFKNKPEIKKSPVVGANESKLQTGSRPSLEELIRAGDEAKFISELSYSAVEDLNLVHTAEGSLLDTAITRGSEKIMSLLIIRGISPFLISDQNYKKINAEPEMKTFIEQQQNDIFNALASSYDETLDSEQYTDDFGAERLMGTTYDRSHFNQKINEARLGLSGCQKFTAFLFDVKYKKKSSQLSWNYPDSLGHIISTNAIIHTLTDTVCAQYVKQFAVSTIEEWLSEEILSQFGKNFVSSKFTRFLTKIRNDLSVTITVTNNNYALFPARTNFSPMALLMLKRECLSDSTFNNLTELFQKIDPINKEKNRTIGYELDSAIDEICIQTKCNLEEHYNFQNLLLTFRIMISPEERKINRYKKYLETRANSRSSDVVKPDSILIREICRKKEAVFYEDMHEQINERDDKDEN